MNTTNKKTKNEITPKIWCLHREGGKQETEGGLVNGKLRRKSAREATGAGVETEAFTFSPSFTCIQIQKLQVSS